MESMPPTIKVQAAWLVDHIFLVTKQALHAEMLLALEMAKDSDNTYCILEALVARRWFDLPQEPKPVKVRFKRQPPVVL